MSKFNRTKQSRDIAYLAVSPNKFRGLVIYLDKDENCFYAGGEKVSKEEIENSPEWQLMDVCEKLITSIKDKDGNIIDIPFENKDQYLDKIIPLIDDGGDIISILDTKTNQNIKIGDDFNGYEVEGFVFRDWSISVE